MARTASWVGDVDVLFLLGGCDMECAFCHVDPDVVALVWRPDGSEQVLACQECAEKEGVWCPVHRKARSGMNGGGGKGTVCLDCVERDLIRQGHRADYFRHSLFRGLPSPELRRLEEWIRDMRPVWQLRPSAILLRGILLEANRRRISPDHVVAEVLWTRTANPILPLAY